MPTQKTETKNSWKGKISNAAQIGGIETSIIDNGPGKGTRIAWVNTGTGLRYKVVLDRAMDIADAFFNQHSLAWISHVGVTPPQPFSDKGTQWLSTFAGGLMTTCGLTHVGGPETDGYGERGLHGRISNIPAQIESIIQPDPVAGKLEMSITGKINESTALVSSLELRRTISGTLGEPYIKIHDTVTNRGNTSVPHMLLYHFNMGWPLADEGSELLLKGKMHLLDDERDGKIFNANNNFRKCPAPLKEHNGTGEAVAYFDGEPDKNGNCVAGIFNDNIGIGLNITFNKLQLPFVANWQHWGEHNYVTGIEPCTNPPIGQAMARKQNTLLFIEPGETKEYQLRLEIVHNKSTN